jgi:hypothetical protein
MTISKLTLTLAKLSGVLGFGVAGFGYYFRNHFSSKFYFQINSFTGILKIILF